jgi:uncharacterized linocin/CFP29 family protein
MNHLRRELSPVLPSAYEFIAAKAREVLSSQLAARRLVDFDGPRGFGFSAVSLGRTRPVNVGAGAEGGLRIVQPMLELRVPFELSLTELDNIERGADDLDVDAVADAARKLAALEDAAVFYGIPDAGIVGMLPSSRYEPLPLPVNFEDFPGLVSEAIARLLTAGVAGPYAIALDSDAYATLLRSTGAGGYPILQHVRRLAEGPTVLAPALRGAFVMSMRGGDFVLTIGEDVSIGYVAHDQQTVRLYLEESLTFRVFGPEAVVSLPRK